MMGTQKVTETKYYSPEYKMEYERYINKIYVKSDLEKPVIALFAFTKNNNNRFYKKRILFSMVIQPVVINVKEISLVFPEGQSLVCKVIEKHKVKITSRFIGLRDNSTLEFEIKKENEL
jgi:hypothetical protein